MYYEKLVIFAWLSIVSDGSIARGLFTKSIIDSTNCRATVEIRMW